MYSCRFKSSTPASLNKSPHLLQNKFPHYIQSKPYLIHVNKSQEKSENVNNKQKEKQTK